MIPRRSDRLVLLGLQLESGLGSVERFRDTIARDEEVGVTDLVVHWPRESEPCADDRRSFERILAEVTRSTLPPPPPH